MEQLFKKKKKKDGTFITIKIWIQINRNMRNNAKSK
jgi:hypothetical protein